MKTVNRPLVVSIFLFLTSVFVIILITGIFEYNNKLNFLSYFSEQLRDGRCPSIS